MHWKTLALLAAGLLVVPLGRADAQRVALSDTLTFVEAANRAEAASPALSSYRLEIEANEALLHQSSRFRNPSLDAEVENLGATGGEGAQATFVLSQPLELGGDRAARTDVAQAELEKARVELEIARRRVIGDVRSQFVAAAIAQESARLAEESVSLAEQTASVIFEQVDAGDRSPVDLTRAEVVVAEAQAQTARARAIRQAAFEALAFLWQSSPDFAAVEAMKLELSVPPMDVLAQRLADNPMIARFAADEARSEAELRLANARRIPDPVILAGYRRFFDPGAGAIVAGISIPLPLFDNNSGNVAAARARLAAVDAHKESFLLEAQALLAERYGALKAAFAEVEILRLEALPRAEDVAARIDEGYREGKFELLDVLDAGRSLITLRRSLTDALSDFHRASSDIASLVGLTGLSLASIVQNPPNQP